ALRHHARLGGRRLQYGARAAHRPRLARISPARRPGEGHGRRRSADRGPRRRFDRHRHLRAAAGLTSRFLRGGSPMIDLYAAGTSNGMRARIALEECGLKYNWHPIDLAKGEHKTPQYLALNPMGQIPVMVDNEGPGGKKVTLAQSSAIMVYCAEKAGKFIPKDGAKKAAMLEAYMSASPDITPGFGSVNACLRAKDPAPYAAAGDMFKQRLKSIFKVWDDFLG